MGGIVSRFKKKKSDSTVKPDVPLDQNSEGPVSGIDKENILASNNSSHDGAGATASGKNTKQPVPSDASINKSQSSVNKSTAKGREANKRYQRKKYLKERATKLKGRLKDRPTDKRALEEYASILYEQEDYQTCPKVINRLIAAGDDSGEWYLKLGKCYFRRWARMGNLRELNHALDCYKVAIKDPITQRNPVHYFEIAAILLRLGKHQACLDTFGTLMSLFKDEYEWVAIAHYNISLVMMQRRNYSACLKLIKDLNVSKLYVVVEKGKDSLFHLPHVIDNISINLEIATVHECMGEKALARNLFYESWESVEKYRLPTNKVYFDYQLGHKTFVEWYNSASTFNSLGLMYRKLHNCIMAAEMFRMAAERMMKLSKLDDIFDQSPQEWRNFSADVQDKFLHALVNRSECLSEIAEYVEAERYAGFVYTKRRNDVHLCGRAAKCCRRSKNSPELIIKLQEQADRMERGILLVQSQYRIRLAQVERHNLKYGIKAGFTVTSWLKMLLVRNRMVERRCSECPTLHINLLVKSLLEGKVALMKTGSEALLAYIELWFLAASTIQQCIKKWYARQNYNKFFKGIRGLERIFRGQICRKRLRQCFSRLQSQLETDPDLDERIRMMNQESLRINFDRVDRLCCGTTCISIEENITGTIYSSAAESPLRVKTRRDRRKRLNPSTGRYEATDARYACGGHSSPTGSLARKSHSRSQSHIRDRSDLNGRECPETDQPTINSFQYASRCNTAKSGFARAASGSGMPSTSRSELSTETPSSTSRRMFSAEAIKDFKARNPDEDIISFISYASVKDDATKQWIPFGVLPEKDIIRLIQCTVLIISSPSFSMQDCKRMTSVIKKHGLESWKQLKSVFVGGTRIGMSGLLDILSLGISHLQSITFSNSKMNHFFGKFLGDQLVSKELVERIKSNSKLPQSISLKTCLNLKKLYIENEPYFGDRGINALFKGLQLNASLQILSIKSCNITNRGAQSCARYIGVSNCIEIINISDNLLDYDGYMSIINAVASRGFRGSLRKIFVCHQSPGYASRDELMKLYHRGTDLGVTMDSDAIGARELTEVDMMRVRDTDKEDIQHMHNVFQQIVEDDRLDNEHALTNSFKKIIYL